MATNGESGTNLTWSRTKPRPTKEIELTPEEAILHWTASNTIRLVPKQNYSIKDIIAIKHEDVLTALEVYFNSDSDIISGIQRIGCTNVNVWTVLFRAEIFKKVKAMIRNTVFIDSSSFRFEFLVEDASVEKQFKRTFVFRFLNLPAHFDNLNAIQEIVCANGFSIDEIDSIYREKMRGKNGVALSIEKADIRVKIKVLPTEKAMENINALTHKAILQIPNGDNLHDLPISIVRVGDFSCNHCGSRKHSKANCPAAIDKKECKLCKSKKHAEINCPRHVDVYYRQKHVHNYQPFHQQLTDIENNVVCTDVSKEDTSNGRSQSPSINAQKGKSPVLSESGGNLVETGIKQNDLNGLLTVSNDNKLLGSVTTADQTPVQTESNGTDSDISNPPCLNLDLNGLLNTIPPLENEIQFNNQLTDQLVLNKAPEEQESSISVEMETIHTQTPSTKRKNRRSLDPQTDESPDELGSKRFYESQSKLNFCNRVTELSKPHNFSGSMDLNIGNINNNKPPFPKPQLNNPTLYSDQDPKKSYLPVTIQKKGETNTTTNTSKKDKKAANKMAMEFLNSVKPITTDTTAKPNKLSSTVKPPAQLNATRQ